MKLTTKTITEKNNCVSNLEWCDRTYNVNYSVELMRKPKSHCRKTSTGIKYVRMRNRSTNCVRYEVNINNKRVHKTFKTLDEAIRYLKEVM